MRENFVSGLVDNDPSSLVNRQIRVYVKTMTETDNTMPTQLPFHSANNYQPSVTSVNLNRYLRKIGLPVPRPYCTNLWLVKDCGGYFGAGFTWFFIFVGETLVMLNLLALPTSIFTVVNASLSLFCAFLGFVGHCRAMLTDPGAVPRGNATPENISKLAVADEQVIYRCPKCDCIKPERAHHCSTCKRCIRKMDHHCPWINNCVGENNQKFFLLFTMYISIISWHALVLSIYTLIMCAVDNFQTCTFSPTISLVVMISLTLEGMMFGLFTTIMCCSQLSAICSDQTGIEQLKKEKRRRRTCWANMKETFGQKFSYKWFSPFHETPSTIKSEPCIYSDL